MSALNSTDRSITHTSTKKIIFIRHGQAEHNVGYQNEGEIAYFSQNYVNSPLTALGCEQAKNLGKQLKENNMLHTIDIVYTSPLERTLQTTLLILDACESDKPTIMATDDARELHYFHPCNARKTKTDMKNQYPCVDFSLIKHEDDVMFRDGDTHDRFIALLQTLKESKNATIMVVTHASFLVQFLNRFFPDEPVQTVDNCECVIRTL